MPKYALVLNALLVPNLCTYIVSSRPNLSVGLHLNSRELSIIVQSDDSNTITPLDDYKLEL